MTSKNPADAADIERRLIAAAAEDAEIPSYRPMMGDLDILFDAGRTSIHRWYTTGYENGSVRIAPRYWTAGKYRLAHPVDVLAILAEERKLRSTDEPGGITPRPPCPTCGQPLPPGVELTGEGPATLEG